MLEAFGLEATAAQFFTVLGIVVVICGGIFAIVFFANRYEANREETLAAEAEKLGLSCSVGRRRSDSMNIPPMRLFREGTRRFVEVIIEGRFRGRDLRVMEFSYDLGGGRHDVPVSQTVALFKLSNWTPSLDDDASMDDDEDWDSEDGEGDEDEPIDWHEEGVASFRLEPRRWNTPLPGKYEDDVVFKSDRAFSKAYLLRGHDGDWVRGTFRSSVRSFFRTRPGWTVECDHFELIAYRKGKRIRARDLQKFCEEAAQICNQFEAPAGG